MGVAERLPINLKELPVHKGLPTVLFEKKGEEDEEKEGEEEGGKEDEERRGGERANETKE